MSGIGVTLADGSATISVSAHLKGLGPGNLKDQISDRLKLVINDKAYSPNNATLTLDDEGGIAYWRATFTGDIHSLSISQRLFPEEPDSRTIVSVTRDGKPLREAILDSSNASFKYAEKQKPNTWNAISQFLFMGVMHIFSGLDHILFILGFILLGGGLKALLKTVTAFTIAHSITLTIAALGLYSPPSKLVEPLIALSIVAVALENLRKRENKKDWRPLIAFGFGLIHGFGFAGGLTEAGLPQASIGWALASFNVGVEIAQAVIVLIATPLLISLAKWKPKASHQVVVTGSMVIALAGAFWFVERIAS